MNRRHDGFDWHAQQVQRARGTVNRWVLTYVGRHGLRTLVSAAQGRYTYAYKHQAEQELHALMSNNSAARIREVYGPNPRFEVRECECYAGHFDPIGVYFDDNEYGPTNGR